MTFGNDNLPQRIDNQIAKTPDIDHNPIWNLINGMDSFFNQFFTQMNTHFNLDSLSVNTYETVSEVIVEVKLPGCDYSQIQLEITNSRLRIGIEGSILEEVNHETHIARKQFYQRREHFIPLPPTVSEKGAKSSFHDETLRVTFPKKDITPRYLSIDETS